VSPLTGAGKLGMDAVVDDDDPTVGSDSVSSLSTRKRARRRPAATRSSATGHGGHVARLGTVQVAGPHHDGIASPCTKLPGDDCLEARPMKQEEVRQAARNFTRGVASLACASGNEGRDLLVSDRHLEAKDAAALLHGLADLHVVSTKQAGWMVPLLRT
jgi:hypothetical protein